MAILDRFSAILLCCDSTLFFWLLAAAFPANPGLRFWESCGSWFCAAKALIMDTPVAETLLVLAQKI